MTKTTLAVSLVWSLNIIACAGTPAAEADDVTVTSNPDTPPAPQDASQTLDVETATTPDVSVAPEVVTTTVCTTDGECDDGDLCTGTETCTSEGTCAPGQPVLCDDGDPCTFDGCLVAAGGCVSVPDTVQCDDDDPCTVDTCLASGCLHEVKGCDDGDPCTDDTCDEQTGECAHTEAAHGPPACDEALTYDLLQLTVRTETNSVNAHTDDGFQLCLGGDLCKKLDVAGYDDLELGATNEFLWPVNGLDPSLVTEVSLSPSGF
ncbi:MAG: hypothetical protein QF464_14550, partial [Myxococcota bacterium]|nr:hypothetical protein [Myxococcota bacterium]